VSLAPEWLVKILQGMGVDGAIIFVLLTLLSGAITTIVILLRHANKVYGYRLAERDKLNEALNNTAKVLAENLKVTEERNELTAEQAELLHKQTVEFVILKTTILAQFETIKDNHHAAMDNYKASVEVVSKLADALRVIQDMVLNNRAAVSDQFSNLRQQLQDAREALHTGHGVKHDAVITEMRRLIGDVTIVKRRVINTRPSQKG
jgi:hypothetical protein